MEDGVPSAPCRQVWSRLSLPPEGEMAQVHLLLGANSKQEAWGRGGAETGFREQVSHILTLWLPGRKGGWSGEKAALGPSTG